NLSAKILKPALKSVSSHSVTSHAIHFTREKTPGSREGDRFLDAVVVKMATVHLRAELNLFVRMKRWNEVLKHISKVSKSSDERRSHSPTSSDSDFTRTPRNIIDDLDDSTVPSRAAAEHQFEIRIPHLRTWLLIPPKESSEMRESQQGLLMDIFSVKVSSVAGDGPSIAGKPAVSNFGVGNSASSRDAEAIVWKIELDEAGVSLFETQAIPASDQYAIVVKPFFAIVHVPLDDCDDTEEPPAWMFKSWYDIGDREALNGKSQGFDFNDITNGGSKRYVGTDALDEEGALRFREQVILESKTFVDINIPGVQINVSKQSLDKLMFLANDLGGFAAKLSQQSGGVSAASVRDYHPTKIDDSTQSDLSILCSVARIDTSFHIADPTVTPNGIKS
ncbi:hypothetical protein HDU93_005338, partial [Gonapodya sp. JEL0774]